jgi:hypothetical protein
MGEQNKKCMSNTRAYAGVAANSDQSLGHRKAEATIYGSEETDGASMHFLYQVWVKFYRQ